MHQLGWDEIRTRALAFSRDFAGETRECAEAKSFWDAFFSVFGVDRKMVAVFEQSVRRLGGGRGRIDLLWKGVVLVEHKSRGASLDSAFAQGCDYLYGLKEAERPRYVIVSDFARLRLYALESREMAEFQLRDLDQHIHRFSFLAGYEIRPPAACPPVDVRAAEKMAGIYDRLLSMGYDVEGPEGRELRLHLLRLIFCMFVDKTGGFEGAGLLPGAFENWLRECTASDGSDFASRLAELYQTLGKPHGQRPSTLDPRLKDFPYVGTTLFEERLEIFAFDAAMRATVLECCALDWSTVNPAIFGALFQAVMLDKDRRSIGAHYTSEENILKVINPLFMDALWEEFKKIKSDNNRLLRFHGRLRRLKFLDPACGCGNFLAVAFRELRLLELEILRVRYRDLPQQQRKLDISDWIEVQLDQFFGIDVGDIALDISRVSMWMMQHQLNRRLSRELGGYIPCFPIETKAEIVKASALQLDWERDIPVDRISYIFGNPPFVGARMMSRQQRAEARKVFDGIRGGGALDYVAAWYVKAAQLMAGQDAAADPDPAVDPWKKKSIYSGRLPPPPPRCAFVSTNSIVQGEQAGILWPALARLGMTTQFAHRSFPWTNEARDPAAVHCVIVGFGPENRTDKKLYEYERGGGSPKMFPAARINAYLVDAPEVFLTRRFKPLCDSPLMKFGNQPIDGGYLILTEAERERLVDAEPEAKKFIRRYVGAEEFINGTKRYCLWLTRATPAELNRMPRVLKRLEQVRQFRENSERYATRGLADLPGLFAYISHEERKYIIVPSVSSERRDYIPMGFLTPDVIASNLCLTVPGAGLYHFGVLASKMHMAWVKTVCGRLKSDLRYSVGIVYNNFPWPRSPSSKHIAAVAAAAEHVLAVRAGRKEPLKTLYNPLTPLEELRKAHQELDRAVDAAYGAKGMDTEAARMSFLFDLYRQIAAPLDVITPSGDAPSDTVPVEPEGLGPWRR